MATCKSCGAEIFWAKTTGGKNMPLDANPAMNGNIALDGDTARVVEPDMGALDARYTSHFATCPAASQHRKPRKT